MVVMTQNSARGEVPGRLVLAATRLLAEQGPSAIKARSVAAAAGMSSMVVYTHFGGVPELVRAVADHGFRQLENLFSEVPPSPDPVADLFAMALSCRDFALANPHLYDLMFGLSTRATYRPVRGHDVRRDGHSSAFRGAFAHIATAASRLLRLSPSSSLDTPMVAASLWSMVHGFITLELGRHLDDFEDSVSDLLLPMAVTFCAGLGLDEASVRASHHRVLAAHARRAPRPA